ncbi:hypothetical protein [Vreelandella alkaliphila]|uniref:hypothetical protein n=1 Tax=Vreelandella alkaliphila TaxID=272774 RepID=UPI00232C5B2B|nr:hypothetical protein [Halomonas alkaliphila]
MDSTQTSFHTENNASNNAKQQRNRESDGSVLPINTTTPQQDSTASPNQCGATP